MKQSLKQFVATIARFLLGLVFILSGFVKAVDPLGTTYKIGDYLEAMGPVMELLTPLAIVAAFALITLEFTLGIMLVLNVKTKISSWVCLGLLIIMTALTLWIAIANPVSDCGCFGDAIILTNWQTFFKNIVLLALATILVLWRDTLPKTWNEATSWSIVGATIVIVVLFMVYTLRHLPIIDFRPYKIGNNLPELMEVPEGAPVDEYQINLIYADANGKEKEFTLENYPKDSAWTFVRQKSKLVKQGYLPPVHDFELMNMEYEDVTYDILESEQPVTLVIMYDLDKADLKQMEKVTQLYHQCIQKQEPFYILTGATDALIEEFCYKIEERFNTKNGCASNRLTPFNHWDSVFCTADPIMLKTIVRANPGVIVIQNGIVIDKYNLNNKKF